jgi:hypothetical protein
MTDETLEKLKTPLHKRNYWGKGGQLPQGHGWEDGISAHEER